MRRVAFVLLLVLVVACAGAPPATGPGKVELPLLRGWFEGQEVFYVTTDVSDAGLAHAKGANFAPRLAQALPLAGAKGPGRGTSVDKVYAFTNFDQGGVFASAPTPMGHLNRDTAYSPLWQLVKVTWQAGTERRTLKSEEEVLSAAEKGQVELEPTHVVLNCPIVSRGAAAGLPGVVLHQPAP